VGATGTATGRALTINRKVKKMKNLLLVLVLLMSVTMAKADPEVKPLTLPQNLFEAAGGLDFDFAIGTTLTLGFIGIYDLVELRGGIGGVPDKYTAWAFGGNINLRKLTGGHVRCLLPPSINAKFGGYYLMQLDEQENGTKKVKNHGMVTVSFVGAL